MFTHQISIRPRYSETDQMGFVYYGKYAEYFEVARVEALRSLGVTYRQMEEDGVMLPVYEYHVKYFKPAFYDDEIIIKTSIRTIPSVKIEFFYESYIGEVKINEASTVLVCVDKKMKIPCKMPQDILEKIKAFFN